jgi:hypothetical protein
MSLLPGNLIDADVGDAVQVPTDKAKGNHVSNGGGDRTPGTLEMTGNLEPMATTLPRWQLPPQMPWSIASFLLPMACSPHG